MSWPSINADEAALLHIFLPFIIGFMGSRLIFGWVNRAGLQSAGFSPTVASILSTPILAFAYYALATSGFNYGISGNAFLLMLSSIAIFAPIFLVLPPLLALYLRGRFRQRKKVAGVLLAAATCLILEFVWLDYLFGHES
jgi:hypothetical protein